MPLGVSLLVNSPVDNLEFEGPGVTVIGRAQAIMIRTDGSIGGTESVKVTISVTDAGSVTKQGVNGDWSAHFNVTPGEKTITIVASHPNAVPPSITITRHVRIWIEPPSLKVNEPAQDFEIAGPGPGFRVKTEGTATDASGISSVKYHIDNSGNYQFLANILSDNNTWQWSEDITGLTIGDHIIEFLAIDTKGNRMAEQRRICCIDKGPPTINITSPETTLVKVTWVEGGVTIRIAGTASDPTTKVKLVEWQLDGGQWKTVSDVLSESIDWNILANLTAPGLHDILVRAWDGVGNPNIDSVQIDVAVPFELDDLGYAAYLVDLMAFTSRRVRALANAGSIPIEKALLTASYHQPFDRLTENNLRSAATRSVAQVRIAVEVLRSYLNNKDQFSKYCEKAYRSLLANFGTSYAEIRLARTADAGTRQAIANRLGIALEGLDKLFLSPEQMTEAKLQTVFCLVDTTQDPLTMAIDQAEILTMQLSKLLSNWLEQDRLNNKNADMPTPIIDPDIIDKGDLKSAIDGNFAYDLLKARQGWVEEQLRIIEAERKSKDTPLEGFNSAVNLVLGNIDLLDLEQRYKDGQDVEATLHTLHLELVPFFVLLGIRKLAETGVVLDGEWIEFYDILVQVKKRREFAGWAEAEINAGLTLELGVFIERSTRPELKPWRSTWRARRNWENKLEARIKQREALIQAHQYAVDATEQVVLPLLRDLLIGTINRQGYPDMDIADWLTQRLSISFMHSGDQKLTRLEQGVETLQDILLTLRSGRFDTLVTLPVGTIAPKWELAVGNTYSENDFDTEWEWMGSYATWRGAMFAFGYPENYLLPTLRDKNEWTVPFSEFVNDVRQAWRLTPDKTEDLAKGYLAKLSLEEKNILGDIKLTSQLTKQQLRERRAKSKLVLEPYIDPVRGGLKLNTPAYLKEVFYFVPMLLALSLQKKGNFLAALDWYQTVYAYELPPNERKIYFGLEAEEALPTEFRRTFGWLLDGLDVFDIADDRANALTRFTLISIVRCYLAFADAEFTRETNESIPFAHSLYNTALKLLDLLKVPPPVAHWTYDKNEGTSASDVTGNGHNATLRGSQWEANGWRSGAISFNGQNEYAEVPHALALALGKDGADFSVTFALYLRENATGKSRILMRKGADQDSTQRTPGIWLQSNNNHVHFRISTTKDWNEGHDSKSEIELNEWTNIAYIKHGKTLRLYINGQLDKEHLLTGASIGFEAPLFIGGDPSYDGANALFDDVRVYDRALSVDAVIALAGIDKFPPNPVITALTLHAELNLQKLWNGRNIAGMERVRSEPAAAELVITDGILAPPSPASLKPTAYRFTALIDRAKQLVAIAQQVEANFFAALEKRDVEAYNLLKAQHDVQLTKETVELQDLRIQEADGGIVLMGLQQDRAQTQYDTYGIWINAGPSQYERAMLKNYEDLKDEKNELADWDIATTAASAMVNALTASSYTMGAATSAAIALGSIAGFRSKTVKEINRLEAQAQNNAFNANLERRKDEWMLQRALANQDIDIATQQLIQAQINKQMVEQERLIASLQADHAEAVVEFLNNKFTNVELYEWMSEILSGVYSYFLQQATATAQLAFNQLAFERQERPPTFIRSDYWQAPSDTAAQNDNQDAPDRRGITGSARLLQDIYQLDQYAFETNKRKLQLVEHLSLARLVPYEFQRFRETGVLPFATPMSLFDRGFPGHYLRLIKRVRVSVVGLIPPTEGIRASLTAGGVSRVIAGGEVYRVAEVRRPPEMIAFTSPSNATGLFELQPENELLLPFETMGVDANWELQLPKAANRFNFNTLADVIFTVEYTALHSTDYRHQVIQDLDRTFSAECAYSLKQDYPDLWYHLHQPEALIDKDSGNIHAQFTIERAYFPPNLQELRIDHVVLYFVRAEDTNFEINVLDLRFEPNHPGNKRSFGSATSMDGVISTRRANAASWSQLIGTAPDGKWTLVFSNTPEFKSRFEDEQITDILFVVSYSGDTPPWPE